MASIAQRLAPRPVATLMDELADALGWPRSRPVRVLAGDRAQLARRVVICAHEAAISAVEAEGTVVLLAVPAEAASGGRSGKRGYDPFVGDPVTGWRRAELSVLDAALPLAGGRGGIDQRIAVLAGLERTSLEPLRSVAMDTVKLVGYLPADALEQVREAVFAAGAGTIGGYDQCSWSTSGRGTFRGGEETDPTIGEPGEFVQVEELRMEVVMPAHLAQRACRAYTEAHPYEEPAFDVVPLATPAGVGFGRRGRLAVTGREAWSALGELDPELAAYGPVAEVPVGAFAAVHSGALREVLGAVLEEEPDDRSAGAAGGLGLVLVGSASDSELDLLVERGIGVLVLDRTRGVQAVGADLAGFLTRATGLAVTWEPGLRFPSELPSQGAEDAQAPHAGADAASPNSGGSSGSWGAASPTELFRMHFDGGSRGNPGPAAYGWVILGPDGEEFDSDGVTVGRATNNVAEWTGLLRGLERALEHGIARLAVRGDSELVIKQVTGVYRVKNADLKPIAEQVKALIPRFEHIDFRHVYRAENARADEIANEALDGIR